MLKIILCGINGKIGSLIYQLATENSHQIVCGIDKKIVGAFDCPVYNSFCEIKEHADVIVDFSSPTSLDDLLDFALTNQTPLVIGTTGYSLAQEEQIVNASKHISVFKSANMSLGINLLIKLCKTATSVLQGFDVEIIDTHHKHKKDAPSGTTKMIFDAINESKYKALSPIYGRRGKGQRKQDEVGIHSLRGGTIVGEHSIFYFGENETITLSHSANSKKLFAHGAIKASEFLVKQTVGLYDMNNLLNI